MISATKAREIFIALKLHFTTDYDYILYNGKTRSIRNQGKQGYFFENIAQRLIDEKSVRDFFIANMIESFRNEGQINSFIGSYNQKEAYITYKKWESLFDSLEYYIDEDLKKIIDKNNSMKSWFTYEEGEHPLIFKLYSAKMISLELVTFLDMGLNFSKKWEDDDPDFIFLNFIKFIQKYQSLLTPKREIILKKLLASIKKHNINI